MALEAVLVIHAIGRHLEPGGRLDGRAEREELTRLRRENKQRLQMDREIFKKTAASSAKETT